MQLDLLDRLESPEINIMRTDHVIYFSCLIIVIIKNKTFHMTVTFLQTMNGLIDAKSLFTFF